MGCQVGIGLLGFMIWIILWNLFLYKGVTNSAWYVPLFLLVYRKFELTTPKADFLSTASCLSYEFYPAAGTGSPRCNLYSASVADSIQSIVPGISNLWSDVGCGSPV